MTDKNLIIIPARGGSKGIPRKNIKDFCGHPLIHYSISVAKAFAPDNRIILSTEDNEIARVCNLEGLPVPYKRPSSLALDTTGSREVILDAMDWAEHRGLEYDKIILLQPTSPMRTIDDVDACIRLYENYDAPDMVVSVVEAACNPYYDCFETAQNGTLHISKGSGTYTRRQDAPKAWQYNGAVYVINPDSLRKMPMGKFERRIPYIMPRSRSVDLDTPTDWIIAENLYKLSNNAN